MYWIIHWLVFRGDLFNQYNDTKSFHYLTALCFHLNMHTCYFLCHIKEYHICHCLRCNHVPIREEILWNHLTFYLWSLTVFVVFTVFVMNQLQTNALPVNTFNIIHSISEYTWIPYIFFSRFFLEPDSRTYR